MDAVERMGSGAPSSAIPGTLWAGQLSLGQSLLSLGTHVPDPRVVLHSPSQRSTYKSDYL